MQKLWARPGQYVGALPCVTESLVDDVLPCAKYYWRYESETWRMTRTYKSPRQYFLEQILKESYEEANLTPQLGWSDQEIKLQVLKEDRARLRALVQSLAIRKLVQQQLLHETTSTDFATQRALAIHDSSSYYRVPPASFHPIRRENAKADTEALSQAQYQVALDPANFERFFAFSSSSADFSTNSSRPLVVAPFQHFPLTLGGSLPPDTRTEKERKRQQKEAQQLWNALGGDAAVDDQDTSEGDPLALQLKALGFEEPSTTKTPEDDLDLIEPPAIAQLSKGPEVAMLSDEDVDWIVEQLDLRVQLNEQEEEARRQVQGDNFQEEPQVEIQTDLFLKAIQLLDELSYEQKQALHALDDSMGGKVMDSPDDAPRFSKQLAEAIPSLTQEQIEAIVQLELSHMAQS